MSSYGDNGYDSDSGVGGYAPPKPPAPTQTQRPGISFNLDLEVADPVIGLMLLLLAFNVSVAVVDHLLPRTDRTDRTGGD